MNRSVVDQDTDRWVAEVLSTPIRRKMEDLEKLEKENKIQWTEIVCDPLRAPRQLILTPHQGTIVEGTARARCDAPADRAGSRGHTLRTSRPFL